MIDLATQASDDYIPLKEIAERQEISEKYLQQIVKLLVEHHMLIGISGKGGGYKLTRRPEDYPVGEILEIMEGTLAVVACLASETSPCERRSHCNTLPMWKKFDQIVHNFFFHITIADLVNGTIPDFL